MIAFIDDHCGAYGVEPICKVLPIARRPIAPIPPDAPTQPVCPRGLNVTSPSFWAPQLVSVEMPDTAAETLAPGDCVVVETEGRRLQFVDYSGIALANISPALLDALPLTAPAGGLACEVRAIAPAEAAGPGLGQDSWIGDLEIAGDQLIAGALDELCFGDLVAFRDIDARTTRFYRPGRIAIGLVSHGPSRSPGHGIGVTVLLTGPDSVLSVSIGRGGAVGALLRRWSE